MGEMVMARCEDYPCCGHELGCCPDYDPDTGEQLNMKCTCGATVPIDSPYSICKSCLNSPPAGSRYAESYWDMEGFYWDMEGGWEEW